MLKKISYKMDKCLTNLIRQDVEEKPHKNSDVGSGIITDWHLAEVNGLKKMSYYSTDQNNRVLGYVYLLVDEAIDTVEEIFVYSFKPSYIFMKDLKGLFDYIHKNYRRIEFSYVDGNKFSEHFASIYGFHDAGTLRKAGYKNGEYVDLKVVDYINENYIECR